CREDPDGEQDQARSATGAPQEIPDLADTVREILAEQVAREGEPDGDEECQSKHGRILKLPERTAATIDTDLDCCDRQAESAHLRSPPDARGWEGSSGRSSRSPQSRSARWVGIPGTEARSIARWISARSISLRRAPCSIRSRAARACRWASARVARSA